MCTQLFEFETRVTPKKYVKKFPSKVFNYETIPNMS